MYVVQKTTDRRHCGGELASLPQTGDRVTLGPLFSFLVEKVLLLPSGHYIVACSTYVIELRET